MYTALLMSLSVALIAAARQQTWSVNWMPVIVAGAALISYVGGQYMDGVELALTLEYARGFVIAVAGQQALHRMVSNTTWFQAIEQMGNPRGLAGQPKIGDKKW